MHAGFARVCITPPLGTRMMGFGSRDLQQGCTGVHDDLHVRALYLAHAGEAALILAYDLCFAGEAETRRFRSRLREALGLQPRQVLLNASHTHVGPSVGTWYRAPTDAPYIEQLESATLQAAEAARRSARGVVVSVGACRSRVPLNRRRMEAGEMLMAPNESGFVFDHLPVALLKATDGEPVCLLFSVSCHPSMLGGWEISAEFPGAAMRLLDERLGGPCSLFLQGVGGDAKPRVVGEGHDRWQVGTFEQMETVGRQVADEVAVCLNGGLQRVEPSLASALTEVHWPLEPALSQSEYTAIATDETQPPVRREWAGDLAARLARGEALPTAATLALQGIRLGQGLRVVGVEGEAVAGFGPLMCDHYAGGVTFPLGYCNGEGLYLPTSPMFAEGGYEVDSYWEYGFPARLTPGFETILQQGLRTLDGSSGT